MQHDGHVTTSDSAATRRRGPLDPRLLRRGRATLGYLIAGVAVRSASAVLTLVQASAPARVLRAGRPAGQSAAAERWPTGSGRLEVVVDVDEVDIAADDRHKAGVIERCEAVQLVVSCGDREA